MQGQLVSLVMVTSAMHSPGARTTHFNLHTSPPCTGKVHLLVRAPHTILAAVCAPSSLWRS